MKKMLAMLLIVGVFGFGGCATIMSGKTQKITLTSEPSGAKVRCGGTVVVTPATIELERKDNHTAKFTLDGYEPQQIQIRKSVNPWIIGNILIGGIPGIVVDLITGAAAELKPQEVHVRFAATRQESTSLNGQAVTPSAPVKKEP